ncbi:MAG: alcohol dehydrogenase catalytic domain-containing protein [Anaerolineae bacterium]
MRAVQLIELGKHIPRYLLTKAVGAVHPPAFWGPLSLIQCREVPEPRLPGPEWVRIGTRYGGICGSDMGIVYLKINPALSAFVSLPIVLGHENVGTITEVGDQVEGFTVGDRVVADPLLPCAVRGIEEPCELCRRGDFSLCQNFAEGNLAPGFSIGACRDTGGSWSPCFVAHQSQLYRLPEAVRDENGVMIEPFSGALHSVMRSLPDDDDVVLVVGAGTIGLCVVVALRALGSRAHVIVVAKYPFQGEMATWLGADEVIYPVEQDPLEAVAEATHGRLYRSVLGQGLLVGGADVAYECVGTERSIRDGLNLTASGGTIVLVGLPGVLRRMDWTPIWLKELVIKGSVWSGTEMVEGRPVPTYELIVKWMTEGKLDLAPLVTHRFRLDEYQTALAVTANKGRHHAIKSVFVFD